MNLDKLTTMSIEEVEVGVHEPGHTDHHDDRGSGGKCP